MTTNLPDHTVGFRTLRKDQGNINPSSPHFCSQSELSSVWEIERQKAPPPCLQTPTSLNGSPRDICSCSSFCSSFRAPMDCWFRTYSESSFSPASVKYLEKCSTLCLLAGKSSWKWSLQLFCKRNVCWVPCWQMLFTELAHGAAE